MPLVWNDLRHSEFFSWFHITELAGQPVDGSSAVVVRCLPGSFQGAINLSFVVDDADLVRQSNLTFERLWLNVAGNAPFGLDLLKSWLLVLGADDASIAYLARQFESLMASQPGVISRTGGPTIQPPTPSAQGVLAVYLGQAGEGRLEGEQGTVVLRNLVSERPALQVVWLLHDKPELAVAPFSSDQPGPLGQPSYPAPPQPTLSAPGGYAPPPGRLPVPPGRILPPGWQDDGIVARPWWKFWERERRG